MRILLLTPQLPWPLTQGTAIRNFAVLRWLARRHTVTLVAFGAPDAARWPLEATGAAVHVVPPPGRRTLFVRGADLLTTRTPDLARRLESRAMTAQLAAVVAQAGPPFDVILVEGLEMAAHALAVQRRLAAAGARPRLVYDAHNAEWVLQQRAFETDRGRGLVGLPGAVYSWFQTQKLRRFEHLLLAAADATVAVSEADAAALRAVAPAGARITVLPNGVDTTAYTMADADAAEPNLCVFTGKMDFRPNIDAMVWFCRQVWPRVLAQRAAARLAIVGRDPAPRVRALADAAQGVAVTGAVADVQPWLAAAGVVVVPLRVGGGTRLKVLEAMAKGKAIAATTLAVEGLHVRDGQEALLADTPEALADAILRLMADAELRRRLGQAARAKAEAEYSWETLLEGLEPVFGDAG